MSDATTPTGSPDDDSPIGRAKAEVDRAKESVKEVRTEISSALEERRGGPVTSPDEGAEKLAELRTALDRDVAALRSRVPDPKELPDETKRNAAVIGGGTLLTLIGFLVLKARSAKKKEAEATREHAADIAREILRLQAEAAAEPEEDTDEGGGALRWVLLLLGALAGAGGVLWQRQQAAATDEQPIWDPTATTDGTPALDDPPPLG